MDDYKDMTVHPYSVRLFKRRWYLIGYSEYSKGMRIYMLDRAADARMLGESFDMPEEFDAEAFFEEFHGVHPSRSEKVCVKVKFLASKRVLVRTIPLHSTQKEIETTSSYSVFEYYLRPNFDFKQEILSYMNSAEVLEPVTLRRELASVLLDMYKLYRTDLIKA
jgi:predicted DNA-binding transcriptional regulator YafY